MGLARRNNYRVLGHIDPVPDHGLRLRTIETEAWRCATCAWARAGRRLVLGFRGRGLLPEAHAVPGPDAGSGCAARRGGQGLLDDISSARWELVLALLGLLFLWWDQWGHEAQPSSPRKPLAWWIRSFALCKEWPRRLGSVG